MKIFTNKKFNDFKGTYDRTIEGITNENLRMQREIKNQKKINFNLEGENIAYKKENKLYKNENAILTTEIVRLKNEIQELKKNVREAYFKVTPEQVQSGATAKIKEAKETKPKLKRKPEKENTPKTQKKKGDVKNAK